MDWSNIEEDKTILKIGRNFKNGSGEWPEIKASVSGDKNKKFELTNPYGPVDITYSQETTIGVINKTKVFNPNLKIKKQDLEKNIEKKNWRDSFILIEIDYGLKAGSYYVVIKWDEDEGFICTLQSPQLSVQEIGVMKKSGSGKPPFGLSLHLSNKSGSPEVNEKVYVAGKDNPYRVQANTYVLMREFGEKMDYEGYKIKENVPDKLKNDHSTIISLIDVSAKRSEERVKYVRLYPPNSSASVAPKNMKKSGRKWLQWYPVRRYSRKDDPANQSMAHNKNKKKYTDGMRWAYNYIEWIGKNAPGRIEEFTIISHARVREVTHFGSNGQQDDFKKVSKHKLFSKENFLDAFDSNGSRFWVTGCNSDTSTSSSPNNCTISILGLAAIEGTLRGRARLMSGLQQMKKLSDKLNQTSSGKNDTISKSKEASTRINIKSIGKALLGKKNVDGYQCYTWQIPSDEEKWLTQKGNIISFKSLQPTYQVYKRQNFKRRANALKGLKGKYNQDLQTKLDKIISWLKGSSKISDDKLNELIEESLHQLEWSNVKNLVVGEYTDFCNYHKGSVDSGTIEDYLKRVIKVLGSDVHYASAFAHFASSNGRSDIQTLGGNPGQDAQHYHVDVSISVDGKDRIIKSGKPSDHSSNVAVSLQFSAYGRNPGWKESSRPWMLSFYRRFGLFANDPFGFFRYDGKLDSDGNFEGWPGDFADEEWLSYYSDDIDNDIGFNYGALQIPPNPPIPSSASLRRESRF